MTSNEYLTDENGLHKCDMCGFATVHEQFIQQHMVKSHGHEEYPAPPIRMEKWDKAEEEAAKRTTKGSAKRKAGGK